MSTYKLAQALSVLRAGMAEMLDEDGVIVTDVAAEMPDEAAAVDDALRRVVRGVLEDQAFITALKEQIAAMTARKKRFEDREEAGYTLVQNAMDIMGTRKKILPEATLTIGRQQGGVIITDENLLPAEYVKVEKTPKKREIGDALREKKAVPGATLGNGRDNLIIRST